MNHDEICSKLKPFLDSLESALPAIGNSSEKERLTELRQDMEKGYYSIVLLGEFNRGKSTILNALLGQELLPMDILPTTAVIHVVRFNPTPLLCVHWRDGRIEELDLSADALKRFVSVESANAVKYLEIGLPAPILSGGVVFIDTPGVDDLNQQRAEITFQFVPKSDSVIFVLDSMNAVRRTEAEFLESSILASGIERLVFVANFADLLDSEDDPEIVAGIQNRLAAALGQGDRTVFLVSARQALRARSQTIGDEHWENSGFSTLVKFLERLKVEGPGSVLKAKQYLRRAQAVALAMDAELERLIQMHEAPEAELEQRQTALVRLTNVAQSRRSKIGEWLGQREGEILAIVGKSLNHFGGELEEYLHTAVADYNAQDFQHFVQKRIPSIVKQRIKGWAQSHSGSIATLLEQVNRQISNALAREFQREILLAPCYPEIHFDVSSGFSITADDVSATVKAGWIAGGAASVLYAIGISMLAPLVCMVGFHYVHKHLLGGNLSKEKAKVLPELSGRLGQVLTEFSTSVLDSLRSEIRNIGRGAEEVFNAQVALQQDLVKREQEERQAERTDTQKQASARREARYTAQTISRDIQQLMESILGEESTTV